MEPCSFPIQFPIHNGLACLCAEMQTQLFFMSIRDNCVRWWLSAALTWEILNLSFLQLCSHRPPMWLFLKPSAPFLSRDAAKLTVFFFLLYRHTLACKVVIVFCRTESLKAGKNLRSHIFPNWKFCFHFVSPSLSFFHPLLHYFLLCHFVGCLCGWPIRLFEFLFPIKSRAHQLWRVTSAQQEGSKQCKTEI